MRALFLAVLLAGCSPSYHFATAPGPVLFPEPRRDTITFWGHACAYVDVGGVGIVTDPVFESKYMLLRPRKIATPPPESYDQTRFVLVSHAHQDHMNPRTLARFPATTTILCPAGVAKYLRHVSAAVRVMRPGDEVAFPGGRIVAVAALHPGGRWALRSHRDGRALGYVIRTPERTVYYSGDTGYFDGIDSVGSRYRPQVALLNINAHLHSMDAVRAINALRAPTVVPLHFGAYGGNRPGRSVAWQKELERSFGSVVVPLAVGETLPLDERRAVAARAPRQPVVLSPAAEAAGVDRYAELEPGLARGARPSEEGLRYLAARGFRTVVSLSHDPEEAARVEALGMDYVEIPLRAGLFSATPPTDEQRRRFLEVVDDPARRPLYFHCVHGKDRTGVMAALYRMQACGWSADEAESEMRALGFHGHYRALLRTVRDYRRSG